MAKFNVVVTRLDEYEVDIDENIWDEKALEDWSSVFCLVSDVEDVAKQLAINFMRNENNYFIEDFGYVKELDKQGQLKAVPYIKESGFGGQLPEEKFTKGLTITALSQSENYDTDITKLY